MSDLDDVSAVYDVCAGSEKMVTAEDVVRWVVMRERVRSIGEVYLV